MLQKERAIYVYKREKLFTKSTSKQKYKELFNRREKEITQA